MNLKDVANRLKRGVELLHSDPRLVAALGSALRLVQLCLTDVPQLIGACAEQEATIERLQRELRILRGQPETLHTVQDPGLRTIPINGSVP